MSLLQVPTLKRLQLKNPKIREAHKREATSAGFGKGAMVKEFEDAVFKGNVGTIQKPVKTNYGYHIIKVTGKTDKKFVVEMIINPVTISASTKDAIYSKAKDFSYIADKNDFEKEAELMNYKVQETSPFVED